MSKFGVEAERIPPARFIDKRKPVVFWQLVSYSLGAMAVASTPIHIVICSQLPADPGPVPSEYALGMMLSTVVTVALCLFGAVDAHERAAANEKYNDAL